MFSRITRRFTYANTVATLALFFAMSGGALAASHYLITSTKQISPKVIKSLKGANGASGGNGAAGPVGQAGPQGPQGAAGVKGENGAPGAKGETGPAGPQGPKGATGAAGTTGFTKTLPKGETETGSWATWGDGAQEPKVRVALASFAIPLPEPPTVIVVGIGEGAGELKENLPAGCKGNFEKPEASEGDLCVFEQAASADVLGFAPDSVTTAGVIARIEFNEVEVESGGFTAIGTWAVTAK